MAIDMVQLREIVASLEAHVAELRRMIDADEAEATLPRVAADETEDRQQEAS